MKNKLFKVLLSIGVTIIGVGISVNPLTLYAQNLDYEDEVSVEDIPMPPNDSPSGVTEEQEAEPESDRLPVNFENQEALQNEGIKRPMDTPASVSGEKYAGSGTVVDFTVTGAKAFYTIQAQDNSVYYIIIDMDKTESNVYFLSEINGEQLTLNEVTTKTQVPVTTTVAPVENNSSSGDLVFYGFILLAGGGFIAYYYFFKIKKGTFKNNVQKVSGNEEQTEDDFDFLEDDFDEDDFDEDDFDEDEMEE